MMTVLSRFVPGDAVLGVFAVVAIGVTLLSAGGWAASGRPTARSSMRHLIGVSALICCLASPVLAWVGAAMGVTILSFPVLPTVPAEAPPDLYPNRLIANEPPVDRRPAVADEPDPASPRADPIPSEDAPAASIPVEINAPDSDEGLEPIAPRIVPPSTSNTPPSERPDGLGLRRRVVAMALLAWAIGASVMLAGLAVSVGRVVRLRRSSRPVRDEGHRSLMTTIGRRFGLRRIPELRMSSRLATPIAVGFGRPMVILPDRLLGSVREDALRDILVHEVAHIHRRDHWIVLLQGIAGALYWPIPTVHALNRAIGRAREAICDAHVLEGRDPVGYGETLLFVAEMARGAGPSGVMLGMVRRRGELERRIAGLLDPDRSGRSKLGRLAATLIVLAFVAACTVVSTARLAASGSDPEETPAPPSAGMALTSKSSPLAPANVPLRDAPSDRDPDDPDQAGHYDGRVLGPDGMPMEGARIMIAPNGRTLTEIGPVRDVTDADGRFAFDAPDMTYNDLDGLPSRREGLLVASADGYAPDWMVTWGRSRSSFRSHWDPIKGAELTLQLAHDDATLHGRFLGPDGRPLDGARVRLASVGVPKDRDLDAYLEHEAKRSVLSGTRDARSLDRPGVLPGLLTETRTDADGQFTVTGIGRDRLAELLVTAPGVIKTQLTAMTREGPDVGIRRDDIDGNHTQVIHGSVFTLTLEPGRTLRGVVRDRDTREPIAGMWVGRPGAIPDPSAGGEPDAITDADGRFTIGGLCPGQIEPRADHNDRSPMSSDWPRFNILVTAVSPPGGLYAAANSEVAGDEEIVIECPRGIPFRLRLTDEQGLPVEAEVTAQLITPHPLAIEIRNSRIRTISRAARRDDGTYEGFVLPGPGVVLARTPSRAEYRPAHVDPKAFFAPGKDDWTAQERISAFGTQDSLSISGVWIDQHDYAAIVLVNPPEGSGPLELSATVVPDRPRQVTLIDPEGEPVSGATTSGLTFHPWDAEPRLRAATFPIDGLHPDRVRRVTFFEDDRELIGFLPARGDAESPYTVRMRPWATVTGRILDENGRSLDEGKPSSGWSMPASLSMGDSSLETNPDPDVGVHRGLTTEPDGRFRIDRLVPGQRYTAEVYRGTGRYAGMAFEDLVLEPGEIRDLGDIRTEPPVDIRNR